MTRANKKIYLKPILILVTLLVLPGFLYYMLTLKGENRYKPLPIFGEKRLSGTFHSKRGKQIPDTIYHRVINYAFVNQNGDTINENTYADQIKVVNFYYNNCDGGCKRVLQAMARADSNYSQNPIVRFMSIRVNAIKDHLGNLKSTASSYHAKAGKWDFVTGTQVQLDTVLKNGFLVDGGGANNGQPYASNKIVLLDNENRIRGYYDGTFKLDLDRLNDEIKVLIVEQLRNRKDFKE